MEDPLSKIQRFLSQLSLILWNGEVELLKALLFLSFRATDEIERGTMGIVFFFFDFDVAAPLQVYSSSFIEQPQTSWGNLDIATPFQVHSSSFIELPTA